MDKTLESLHQQWQKVGDSRQKDYMVAQALGVASPGDETPHYTTSLHDAQGAMDQAWALMEEVAPVRISCHFSNGGRQGSRECYVEWWPADGDHLVTPAFPTEAESRAFAAFVFAELLGKV